MTQDKKKSVSGLRKRSRREESHSEVKRTKSEAVPEEELFKVRLMEVSYLETEFRILRSLIPGLSKKSDLSELDIIDACVTYIESLQNQLHLHDPGLLLLGAGRALPPSTSEEENEENRLTEEKTKKTSSSVRNTETTRPEENKSNMDKMATLKALCQRLR